MGDRIEALRLVHDQLHSINAADELPLRPYPSKLLENLISLHEEQAGAVQLDFEMLDVDVSPDKAMPLGLIVNEFVTNSLKYAFDRNGGKISVRGKPRADDRMRLAMSDNGKGLQAASAAPSGSGSDMKIIHALAEQLGAQIDWSSAGGVVLGLEFFVK